MTRKNRLNMFAAAVMLAVVAAWPADALAQRGSGSRGGGGQHATGRPAGSRPVGGQPAAGHATPRPVYGTSGGYRGTGYRGYYAPTYRGYYAPYYRGYYSPYYWGWGFGLGFGYGYGWGSWYGDWGYQYPYPPYGPRYPYPYPNYYEPGSDLRLQVTPRDAEVYLDGYLVGIVDNFDGTFQRLRVPYGEHEIAIYFNGYRTIDQKMLFRPGESYHIKQPMQPLGAGEQPEPRPTPSAAPQANEPGPPPMRGRYEPPTGGRVETQMPRRDEPETAPPGEARGDFGTLAIRVQPGDAEIVVDGERWDSPSGGERLTVDLAEGTHHVEIKKDGFKPYSADVQVRRGRTASLNVSLPKGN